MRLRRRARQVWWLALGLGGCAAAQGTGGTDSAGGAAGQDGGAATAGTAGGSAAAAGAAGAGAQGTGGSLSTGGSGGAAGAAGAGAAGGAAGASGASGGAAGAPPRECAATETCGDGDDDDCDGRADGGCRCLPGEALPCFLGDPAARGVGACLDGQMLCEGTGEFGTWGACQGGQVEAPEACDLAGVDEDCDGAANEGCECNDGQPPVTCGTDEGVCTTGLQRCEGGRLTPCEGAVMPAGESCNGLDDDCDGAIDDAVARDCGPAVGACRPGREICRDGLWGACDGGRGPAAEVCNGVDDDCDGIADDGANQACGLGIGRCTAGVRLCSNGVLGSCDGAVDPVTETCNALDDDCDGTIDDGLTEACGSATGECRAGIRVCTMGTWGDCLGDVEPAPEVCEGSLDEDCDGTVDDGCGCTTGATRPCGTDLGACRPGTQRCVGGQWEADCIGGTGPTPETCNTLDDDCDGVADPGCLCVEGATRPCGSSVGECRPGAETCTAQGQYGPCLGGVRPTAELCNALDDDCDGVTDPAGTCPTVAPTVTCPASATVAVGSAVPLVGAGSDADGGSVTYAWSVVSRPTGALAAPAPASAATTSLTPDGAGDWVLRLCVTDDEAESACCTVGVTATATCAVPAAPALSTCGTSWDRRPLLEFTALPAGVTYEVWRDGDATPLATLAQTGQNHFRPPTPLGLGAPPPGAPTAFYVRACSTSDPTCCSASAVVTARLVESCTTPVPPTANNVLFSEYIIDGDGGTCPGDACEAGEAIEITNLSHCPVSLQGFHFSYLNSGGSSPRWMNFGAVDVVPPRGVYVAVRNPASSTCAFPFLGADDPALFGLRVSALQMQGSSLTSGWFANTGGGSSLLRIASGAYTSATSGTTIARVAPYAVAAECSSKGFNALDACGDVVAGATPTTTLTPNQLGRLWRPCDAVQSPVPACQ